MSSIISISKKYLITVAAIIGILTVVGNGQSAQAQTNSNIRVMVMGEDSDRNTVPRTSDVFKRVLAELKESMHRKGFRLVDEEFVAAELGWRITERRPKIELVQAMKLANNSGKAHLSSRAMMLFRIHTNNKKLDFANRVEVRIDGELYDGLTNEFKGAFEIPRSAYSAPDDCNSRCISEVVGDHAREIAISLGDVMAVKLAYISPSLQNGSVGGSSTGRETTYTIKFKRFNTTEVMEIMHVMSNEFPGYKSHELLKKAPSVSSYEYLTTAKVTKLDKWMNILLMDLGLTPDTVVVSQIRGTVLTLDKISSPPRRQAPVTDGRYK
jgi:hypothetical protein